jgi:hypothetical protein
MDERQTRDNDLAVVPALTALEVDYWYEVDHNWGREAHRFYVPDGVFSIGDKSMRGAEAVAGFYRWREGRGERTARHVVSNFRLDSVHGNTAKFSCIMCLYAADGAPVRPSLPAIMIADIHNECRRGEDGRWRFVSHVLVPIFTGGEPATLPPE